MISSSTIDQLSQLSVEERLELLEALWQSISREPTELDLTPAQHTEIESRLREHAKNPCDVVTWDVVKADLGL